MVGLERKQEKQPEKSYEWNVPFNLIRCKCHQHHKVYFSVVDHNRLTGSLGWVAMIVVSRIVQTETSMNGHDGHLLENEFQVFVVKLNEKYSFLFEGILSTHSTVVVSLDNNPVNMNGHCKIMKWERGTHD